MTDNIEKTPSTQAPATNEHQAEVFTHVDALSPTQVAVLSLALPLACRNSEDMSDAEAITILKQTESKLDDLFKWTGVDLDITPPDQLCFGDYPNLEDLRASVAEWLNHKTAKDIIENETHTQAIILNCVAEAKKLGALQPSALRWLMFYDKALFTAIQNEDKTTPTVA